MELTGLLPIIRRWLVVIIAATAMATLVGVVLGSSSGKTYEARTQLLVGPLNTDSNTTRASGDLAQTYAQLATSRNVLDTVATDVGVSKGKLSSVVRATANSATRFLVIRARSEDPKAAAKVANSVAIQLIVLGREDPTRPEGKIRVIDAATAPSAPVSPRLGLIVPLAAAAGLLGSLTLILLFEFVGDTAETADDVDAITHLPTLVVKRRRLRSSGPDPYIRRIEPYRIIATQADLSRPKVRCILLTDASSAEGSSSLVLELAEIWGERRERVVVVDAGVGEITSWAGLEGAPGLAQLVGRADSAVPTTPWIQSVDVLGTGIGRRTEAVSVDGARNLVDLLAGENGLVVVHGLPPTSSAATLVWARVADVTILLVRRSQSRRTSIEEAMVNLRTVNANLTFSVLHEGPRASGPRFGATKPTSRAMPVASKTSRAGRPGTATGTAIGQPDSIDPREPTPANVGNEANTRSGRRPGTAKSPRPRPKPADGPKAGTQEKPMPTTGSRP